MTALLPRGWVVRHLVPFAGFLTFTFSTFALLWRL